MHIVKIKRLNDALLLSFSKSLCIWNTDKFALNDLIIKKLIHERCLCVISLGLQNELLHDIVDEEVVIYEIDNDIELEIDTRWEESFKEALWQAKNCMFEDVKEKMTKILILT